MSSRFWGCSLLALALLSAGGFVFRRQATGSPLSAKPSAARAMLAPASPQSPATQLPHQPAADLSGSLLIHFLVPAPAGDKVIVVAATGKDSSGGIDAYGGAIYLLKLADGTAQLIAGGTNLVSISAPVWSHDAGHVYFELDTGNCHPGVPGSSTACGIYDLDVASSAKTQLTADSTLGLALSPDGSQLAFWDLTRNDQLVVFDLPHKQIAHSWGNQVHAIDDAQLSDIAFTPDSKSVLALTYGDHHETMLRQFDPADDSVRVVAPFVQSLAAAADGVYYLQFQPVPLSDHEAFHTLYKVSAGAAEPVKVQDDFPYSTVSAAGSGRWITARARMAGLYDTQSGAIRTAGSSCHLAAVVADGTVLYAFGGELIRDAKVCDGPPPPRIPGD